MIYTVLDVGLVDLADNSPWWSTRSTDSVNHRLSSNELRLSVSSDASSTQNLNVLYLQHTFAEAHMVDTLEFEAQLANI